MAAKRAAKEIVRAICCKCAEFGDCIAVSLVPILLTGNTRAKGTVMDIASLIAQVVGGAAGGVGGSKLLKDSDMGPLLNAVVGGVGGLGGGGLLGAIIGGAAGNSAGGADIGAIAGQLVGGGVGGVVLQVVIGLIKNKLLAK